HKLITYGEETRLPFTEVNWILKAGNSAEERKAFFKINSLSGMLRAVENGIGIAGLPDYMVQGNTLITKVLPDIKGPTIDVYFMYSMELRNSKRIKVFRDFLI